MHLKNLVYNTCWEDPRLDREAMQLQPDDEVVMITSAGCNALPQVTRTDAAPTQLVHANLLARMVRERQRLLKPRSRSVLAAPLRHDRLARTRRPPAIPAVQPRAVLPLHRPKAGRQRTA